MQQRWQTIGVWCALALLVLFPRVLALDAFRAPDEDRWMANAANFTRSLALGQWQSLVQQPHPGITTQWLGALTIRSDDWAIRRLPIVVAQAVLLLAIGYVWEQRWGRWGGAAVVVVLALDPFLYAHTRVYAMDGLLALCAVLSLSLLLLWRAQGAVRYSAAAGALAAAATLSKLPGIILLPFSLMLFGWWFWQDRRQWRQLRNAVAWWLVGFVGAAALLLPSLVIVPQNVLGDFAELFRSDEYQEKHQLGLWYYGRSLLFFSTPVQWLALLALPALAWFSRQRQASRKMLTDWWILLLFALLFALQMTLGAKKGDRYILPSFVALDVIAAGVLVSVWRIRSAARWRWVQYAVLAGIALALAFQAGSIGRTHPHTLAYVNPITQPWFGQQRLGWGEGLDLAAAYLNRKSGADQLVVAAPYPHEFAPYFNGETVPIHQHDESKVDYVVVYRSLFERGPTAWETDVVNYYRDAAAEHIISIGGVPMAWIYQR